MNINTQYHPTARVKIRRTEILDGGSMDEEVFHYTYRVFEKGPGSNKRMHKKGTRDKWLVIENSPLWNDCFEQPLTPPEPDATPDAEPSKRKKAA
jgi:hypothetical protein